MEKLEFLESMGSLRIGLDTEVHPFVHVSQEVTDENKRVR
jgi:hypothetical protein